MSDYSKVIEAAINKEIEILGEDTALGRAREVEGLEVDDSGEVVGLEGSGTEILRDLVKQYEEIGGSVTASLIAREIKDMDIDQIELPEELSERL